MDEEKILEELFERYKIEEKHRSHIREDLDVLGAHHEATRLHSIRVAYYATQFGEHCGIVGVDPKVLFWVGIRHDMGKRGVNPEILSKTDGFTDADYEKVKPHVEIGYAMFCDKYAWTANILVRHHRYERKPYPEILPPLPDFLVGREWLIDTYASILRLADHYDAIGRNNTKHGGGRLSPEEKRERYLLDNADRRELILRLEARGVLVF